MVKFLTILVLFCSLAVAGCGSKKAASSSEAINVSKTMETVQEKVNYLVEQAKAFYDSKDFQQTVKVAQYILQSLDKDSQQAKTLLEKAKTAILEAAKTAAEDMKNKLGDLGK